MLKQKLLPEVIILVCSNKHVMMAIFAFLTFCGFFFQAKFDNNYKFCNSDRHQISRGLNDVSLDHSY